jgi:hypothetical protein
MSNVSSTISTAVTCLFCKRLRRSLTVAELFFCLADRLLEVGITIVNRADQRQKVAPEVSLLSFEGGNLLYEAGQRGGAQG